MVGFYPLHPRNHSSAEEAIRFSVIESLIPNVHRHTSLIGSSQACRLAGYYREDGTRDGKT